MIVQRPCSLNDGLTRAVEGTPSEWMRENENIKNNTACCPINWCNAAAFSEMANDRTRKAGSKSAISLLLEEQIELNVENADRA